jgi:hypothetical protein
MPHTISWRIPDHVIVATLTEGITADEVQQIADQMYDEIAAAASESPVHTLVDVRECGMQDKVWNYAKLNFRRHPNSGWSIVIGDSRLGGLVIAIFSKILNQHIRYSESLESSMKILSDHHVEIADRLNS